MTRAHKFIPARKRSALQKAVILNNLTYTNYLERLQRIALSMFKWENLPQGMNEAYLEWTLYTFGQAALIKDPVLGFLNTQVTTQNKLNIYNLPVGLHCYGIDYNRNVNTYFGGPLADAQIATDYGVLVQNDMNRSNTMYAMQLFAIRLTDIQRSMDVNAKQQKTPYVILTDDRSRMTFLNAFQQIDDNVINIVTNKNNFDPNAFKTISTGAPYLLDKLNEAKIAIWNEALTYLGINNLKEKKERLVAEEALTNNEIINLNLQSFLEPRELACKQFNELFNLTGNKEVKVRLRSDLQNTIKQAQSIVNDFKNSIEEAEETNE